MANPTSVEIFNNIISTAIANASTTTGYSFRTRNAINPPNPFPVASSPPRQRSKKRTTKGYKPTPTVTIPAKHRITKPTTPSPKLSTDQKAAIRAIRHEARQFAKATPYVPKPRTRRPKTSTIKKTHSPKPTQKLTITEEHSKTVANAVENGGWAAKGVQMVYISRWLFGIHSCLSFKSAYHELRMR